MKTRSYQKEQLDDLNLHGDNLHQTLAELAFINRYFGNYAALRKSVLPLLQQSGKRSVHIVDLGCGGGDVLLFLAKLCRSRGIQATFLGLDGNSHSLAYASKQAILFSEIKFQVADILAADFRLPDCDILISTHFLYHFDNQQFLAFFEQQRMSVKLGIIANELRRSNRAFWFFKTFSPFLGFSKLTRQDGVLAIKRAFSKGELTVLMKKAGFVNFSVKKRFIFGLTIEALLND